MANGNPTQTIADVVPLALAGIGGLSWFDIITGALQVVLTIVGIGAGIAAWRWHRAQRIALEKKHEPPRED